MAAEIKYELNPKIDGSGIIAAVPQKGVCILRCKGCFAFDGRSYVEVARGKSLPLDLSNMPDPEFVRKNNLIVRVNDLNDSNNERELVVESTKVYERKFFNTAMPKDLAGFGDPVVLTINPALLTDKNFYRLKTIPPNLMFVRMRTNVWNLPLVDEAIKYYTLRSVPVILTFMAYYDASDIPEKYKGDYVFRKRTLNSYDAITTDAWRKIMEREIEFDGSEVKKLGISKMLKKPEKGKENEGNNELVDVQDNDKIKIRYENLVLVHSCGTVEGEMGKTSCKSCGNCLREYYATKVRLQNLPK